MRKEALHSLTCKRGRTSYLQLSPYTTKTGYEPTHYRYHESILPHWAHLNTQLSLYYGHVGFPKYCVQQQVVRLISFGVWFVGLFTQHVYLPMSDTSLLFVQPFLYFNSDKIVLTYSWQECKPILIANKTEINWTDLSEFNHATRYRSVSQKKKNLDNFPTWHLGEIPNLYCWIQRKTIYKYKIAVGIVVTFTEYIPSDIPGSWHFHHICYIKGKCCCELTYLSFHFSLVLMFEI